MITGRLKQSKPISAVGFFGGILFIGLGVFLMIPTFGSFGIIWTVFAAIITAYHGYGLFSKRGVSLYEVEAESHSGSRSSPADRLTKLEDAKNRGLVSESEYKTQRNRILSDI
jgi:hypothetical protein